MARRRGKGEGNITQRADGRWMVRVDLGRDEQGRRQRKCAYASTQGGAVELLRKLGGRAAQGQLLTTSTPTVERFLEEWFGMNTDSWRPSTQRGYRAAIDRFLVPAFGTLRLEQLSPQIIKRWLLQHKTAHGARRRITLAHATLRSALAEAQDLQLVTINAARLVKVPRPPARQVRTLDLDQAKAFMSAVESHRLAALFSVALACGLRLGEATGLRWDDVDLTTGELRVRQQLQRVGKRLVLQDLKTEKSRRTLALPQVCLDALKAHRKTQLQERLKAGAAWTETGLVFTIYMPREGQQTGTALHPRNVLRTLHTILAAAKLPRVRFHDLRHSAASLLIAKGVELIEVSMLLGHSEIRVTSDLYSHLQKQTAAKAASHMDAIFDVSGRGR